MLILNPIVLDAEFNCLCGGIIFKVVGGSSRIRTRYSVFFEIFAFEELVISRTGLVFTRWYQLRMMPSDRELNSAPSTTNFRISTDSWANPDKNHSGKLLILVVFWPKPLIFGGWPPPWKWRHGIENKISCLAQPDLESAQIHRRIWTTKTRIWC